jgi:hypothetical protein
MSTQIQTRRGTTSQHSSFTGAAGEITVDTDKNVVVVHDGSTAGGHPLQKPSDAVQKSGDTMTGALGVPAGSAASPSVYFDADSGLYSPGADEVAISTGATERLRLTPDGKLGLGTSSPAALFEVSDSVSATDGEVAIRLSTTASAVSARNEIRSGHTDNTNPYLSFAVRESVTPYDVVERMRLDSSGRLGLGTSVPGNYLAGGNNLVVSTTGSTGITIAAGASSSASLYFADGASGTAAYRGYISYNHASDSLVLGSSGITRATIDSSGTFRVKGAGTAGVTDAVQLSGSAPANSLLLDASGRVLVGTSTARGVASASLGVLQIETAETSVLSATFARNSADAAGAIISLGKSRSTAIGSTTIVQNGDTLGDIRFAGADGTDLESIGARIHCEVDGTPGSDDMPGGIVLSTTASGSAAPVERVRIDSSGRLLVGASSAATVGNQQYAKIQLVGNSANSAGAAIFNLLRGEGAATVASGETLADIVFGDSSGAPFAKISGQADANAGSSDYPGRLVFYTTPDASGTPVERTRITQAGVLSSFSSSTGFAPCVSAGAGTSTSLIIGRHTATGVLSGTNCFVVWSNGNVQNTNDSYGAISDIKLKENIVDAESQWDDFKAIRFRKYNFKEETGHETFTQLGVIAQELELVSPGLVTETPDVDEDGNDLGTTTKGVKYSILTKKALVALQEAMERIEQLEAKVTALENP